jgi:hypothetical protein
MHARLAETMTFVEEKRRELLQSFEGIDGEKLCRRVAPDGWSVAEILEHLGMVESRVARLITKRVGQAREAGLGEEKSTDLYQWLIFVGQHEGRHKKQIERTLKSIPT